MIERNRINTDINHALDGEVIIRGEKRSMCKRGARFKRDLFLPGLVVCRSRRDKER